MNHLYINREWLLSPIAQRVYLGCACLTVAFFAILAAEGLLDDSSRHWLFDSAPMHLLLAVLVRGVSSGS